MSFDVDALARVVNDVIAPAAPWVDVAGEVPKDGIAALREAGFLGLSTAAEIGGAGDGGGSGGGGSLGDCAEVIEMVAGACGSTAMILLMHYAACAVIEAHGPVAVRRAIASGDHLSTLAFSEVGSRSHFWAPVSTAVLDGTVPNGAGVQLDAKKSWVTSAAVADSYVWSSRPVEADGPMTLWLVPSDTAGLEVGASFDGFGLRGNGSVPVTARQVAVPLDARLGDDGAGLDIALATALPWFLVLSTAFALGLMEAVLTETRGHLQRTRLEHLDQALINQPLVRVDFARMQLATDSTRAFLSDTLAALSAGREDAVLRVLESKALGAEAAITVTDLAMKVGGGAAFRKELGIERRFRDARAARVMAPTTDALLDFVGRAVNGLALLDS
jgi:alkylation response protein AidB-like acyl-CoA dehydrogenase